MNDLLYVCSPYRGDTKRNKEYARRLTRAAINNGFVPVTVHLYLTEVTDDQNPEERSRGMAAGMKILENCKYILIGDKYGVQVRRIRWNESRNDTGGTKRKSHAV